MSQFFSLSKFLLILFLILFAILDQSSQTGQPGEEPVGLPAPLALGLASLAGKEALPGEWQGRGDEREVPLGSCLSRRS